MATIGQKLGEARREAGLSVADVAHETHIHANMIYSIEEDDFSKFASVAYAKSFIRNYAEFLEVDLGNAMEALDSSKTLRLGEHELMGEMKKTIKKDRLFRLQKNPGSRRRLDKPGGAPVFLNIILVTLIAAIVVFYFLGYKASSPEEAREEIAKGLQKANPFGAEETGTGEVDAVAVADPVEENPLRINGEKPKEAAPTLQRVELPGETALPVVTAETGNADRSEPRSPAAVTTDDIEKPEVNWSVEESQPSPLARVGTTTPGTLKTPDTPEIEIESEEIPIAPIQSAELPKIKEVLEEPAAALRPAGTDPVPEGGGGAETTQSDPPRAVPVAATDE